MDGATVTLFVARPKKTKHKMCLLAAMKDSRLLHGAAVMVQAAAGLQAHDQLRLQLVCKHVFTNRFTETHLVLNFHRAVWSGLTHSEAMLSGNRLNFSDRIPVAFNGCWKYCRITMNRFSPRERVNVRGQS